MRQFKNVLSYLKSQVAIMGVVYDRCDEKITNNDTIIINTRDTWGEVDYVSKDGETLVLKCDCGECDLKHRTVLVKDCEKLKEIRFWEN